MKVLSECKTEKRTSTQWSKKGACFACDSGVVRCQSQHQCHLWRMNSIFEAYLHGLVSLAAISHICVIHETMNGCKNLKVH